MTYDVIKLDFFTPLHLSGGRMDAYDQSEEILHSDTIKSALFVMARKIYGNSIDKSFLDAFKVSSAMPFLGSDYLFPKPMMRIGRADTENAKNAKFIKKLAYFSLPIFEKIIAGQTFELNSDNTDNSGRFYFANNRHKTEKVFESNVQQRFTAPKGEEKHGMPYYVDRLYFNKKAGLYFLLEFIDESFKSKVHAAIRLLGDEGIGTDRTVGNGQFTPIFGESLTIQTPSPSNALMNLSLFCPTLDGMTDENLQLSSYQLLKRGGYIASPENSKFITFRKRSIFMFSEGSVFPKNVNMAGKLVDLRPIKTKIDGLNHPIWRDGRPISLPVNILQDA